MSKNKDLPVKMRKSVAKSDPAKNEVVDAGNDTVAIGRFARIGTLYHEYINILGLVGDILGIDFDGWWFCRINWKSEFF